MDSRSVNKEGGEIMAIYHFSAQVISRGKGQSAVACASYRSGDRLTDERTGETKFYRREIQPDTMILAPSHAPEWVYEREFLWNAVESAEKRKDAQLAREINIALPKELSADHQKELIQDYIQKEFVDRGMVADIAIHRDDPNNPHAHVMLTTREITAAEGFGSKNRSWNDRGLLEQWREEWANYANKALERENIQERISHLSHEARGLEQMPTVHLGHVAHAMEKRGVQTDRGNLNRERQEHNRLVVDLQTYREEKEALEKEKVEREKQEQKTVTFNTEAERTDLKTAANILKVDPSLENIVKRRGQLNKWEERINNGEQYLRWKDDKVKEASGHFDSIHFAESRIQDAQRKMELLNWLNPLKIKENRSTKEKAEQTISDAQKDIHVHQEKLDYHREKLGFSTESEFNQVKAQHEADRPGLLEKNVNARRQIHYERDVLKKAEMAHKNAVVREVASLYPEHPEMRHMSFNTAVKVVELNSKYKQVVPIKTIQQALHKGKTEIRQLQSKISEVECNQTRLERAKGYLKNYEKYQSVIEEYEKNPLLKGKMLVSKSTKQEYEKAVSARNHYKGLLKQEGISGKIDFEQQTEISNKMIAQIPGLKGQIQTREVALSLFDAITNGIEQVNREMQQDQQKRKKRKINQLYQGMDR